MSIESEPITGEAQAVQAAKGIVDGRLVDQLMAEEENRIRDSATAAREQAARGRKRVANWPDNDHEKSTFLDHSKDLEEMAARSLGESLPAEQERIRQEYEKIMGHVNAIRERASLATTSSEKKDAERVEELLAQALDYAGVTSNTPHIAITDYYQFVRLPEIQRADALAARAGDGHRTAKELHAFLQAHKQGSEEPLSA